MVSSESSMAKCFWHICQLHSFQKLSAAAVFSACLLTPRAEFAGVISKKGHPQLPGCWRLASRMAQCRHWELCPAAGCSGESPGTGRRRAGIHPLLLMPTHFPFQGLTCTLGGPGCKLMTELTGHEVEYKALPWWVEMSQNWGALVHTSCPHISISLWDGSSLLVETTSLCESCFAKFPSVFYIFLHFWSRSTPPQILFHFLVFLPCHWQWFRSTKGRKATQEHKLWNVTLSN